MNQIIRVVGLVIAFMWTVQIVNFLTGQQLNQFGILPRNITQLPGIVTAPFIHGDFSHLSMNTIPFVILASLVCVQGVGRFFSVSLVIIVIGGLLVWLFGRDSYHVGASGWIFGLWGYLLAFGFFRRDFRALAIALIVIFSYGGLIYGLFSFDSKISSEGHLFGAAAGFICGWVDAGLGRYGKA